VSSIFGVLIGVLGPLLVFALVITPLIVVHEFGHLIAARWRKIDVPEFGIGFPPRILTLHRGTRTEVTLNAIPIGGFVRLAGAEEGSDDLRGWQRASLRSKVVVMLAGVSMNLAVAVILLTVALGPLAERGAILVGEVQAGSPAALAGLVTGDRITEIDGAPFDRQAAPLLGLRDRGGEVVAFTVRHADGSTNSVTIKLRAANEAATHGALGITVPEIAADGSLARPFTEALPRAVAEAASTTVGLFDALWHIVTGPFRNGEAAPAVAGPIGLSVAVAANADRLGLVGLIHLAGLLSVNLAALNVLPIPPLDGGRIAAAILRRALGERRGVAAERLLVYAGLALMLVLFAWITLGDVLGIAGGSR